eukprot:jgi/Tetstr1/448806/TSEL_036040.t1
MDLDGPALPSSWNLLKAAMLKSENTWHAVKELMEAYRDCRIPHPNEEEVRAALVKVNESKISKPVGIKNAFALADVPVPKHYKIHWCLEAKLSPRGAGIAWDMEIQHYVSQIVSGDLKFFPMGTRVLGQANPRPKVKPDPKPAAPAAKAKAKAKPKTDRNPAAPKSKSKSKVAPEPPKAKAKSKVAPKPPKGGDQISSVHGYWTTTANLYREANELTFMIVIHITVHVVDESWVMVLVS